MSDLPEWERPVTPPRPEVPTPGPLDLNRRTFVTAMGGVGAATLVPRAAAQTAVTPPAELGRQGGTP